MANDFVGVGQIYAAHVEIGCPACKCMLVRKDTCTMHADCLECKKLSRIGPLNCQLDQDLPETEDDIHGKEQVDKQI